MFVYNAVTDSVGTAALRDTIGDFQSGIDRFDLSLIDANTLIAGNNAFTYIGSGAFTNTAGQLRYTSATGQLLGDTNGDGIVDFRVGLLNLTTLTAADLIL